MLLGFFDVQYKGACGEVLLTRDLRCTVYISPHSLEHCKW